MPDKSYCEEHAMKNTPNRIRERNVIAVHPYFDEIHFGCTRDPIISRLENLMLKANGYGKILFETYEHYLENSSKLVDGGLIDKVIFTKKNIGYSGWPVREYELEEFHKTKENFIGGCYGNGCVAQAFKALRNASFHLPKPKIKPIRDATLFVKTKRKPTKEDIARWQKEFGLPADFRFKIRAKLGRGVEIGGHFHVPPPLLDRILWFRYGVNTSDILNSHS